MGPLCLIACNDPEERKTHYVTVFVSQDVEIRETLVDIGMKKPGVVVVHPEGVEVIRRPTKPRNTVSFEPWPQGFFAMLLLVLLSVIGWQARLLHPPL